MIQVEGIILKQIPYRENERIVTLYSKERGLLQFLIKGLSPSNLHKLNLVSPLCLGEYHLKGKEHGWLRFVDGTILNLHLPLRENIKRLEASTRILSLILHSQLPEKPSILLFQLLKSYLSQLTKTEWVAPLLLSFELKLLKHEGMIGTLEECHNCHTNRVQYFLDGESYCAKCRPPHSTFVSEKEWSFLYDALHLKDFQNLKNISLVENQGKKLHDLLNYF